MTPFSRLAMASVVLLAFAAVLSAETPDVAAAQEALRQGHYGQAEELYRNELKAHPTSPETLEALGFVLSIEGKTQQSVKVMRDALARNETPRGLAVLGANYCRMRDYDSAANILNKATRYFDNDDVVSTLAPCYLEAGEPIYAVLAYEKLAAKSPGNGENAASLVRACWHASRSYGEALKKLPGSETYEAALARARESGATDARGAMQEALQAAPYLTENTSLATLASLLTEHRAEPAMLYFVTVVCGEMAIRSFEFVEEHYPNSVAVKSLHAQLFVLQEDAPRAIAEYETLVGLAPRRVDLRHNLAVLYLQQRDWGRALAEYRVENANSPGDLRAVAGISECLLNLGRYQEDLRALAQVINSQDAPEWSLLDTGSANEHLGRLEAAVHAYEQVEKRNPMNRSAHYRLLRLYKRMGRDGLAKQEAAALQNVNQRGSLN